MLTLIMLGVFGGLMLFKLFPWILKAIIVLICLHFLIGWPA